MLSKYYTEPSNIVPGLQMFGQGLQKRSEFERERVKKGKADKLKKQVGAMMGRPPEEIAKFVSENPESGPLFKQALGAQSDAMLSISKQYLIDGQDPFNLHIAGAEKDIVDGVDPAGNIEMARAMAGEKTRGEATKKHEMVLAMLEPKTYAAYMKQQGKGAVTSGKPTADIINYDQAKNGGYKGSFMDFLAEKKTKPDEKTKDIKEYEYGLENPDFVKDEKTTGFGDFTEEQKDAIADQYTESGKFEFTGRSMEIKKHNAEIKKRSLERQKAKGVDAINTYYNQLDKKGMTADINSQQKKLGSMRSFSINIKKQKAKIHEVANKLFKMDAKLLNIPFRKIMEDYIGSADRAVLRTLVGELSQEVGKLASGATDSISELSEGAREKWDKIYNLDLPTKTMLELVDESENIANMRVDSMKEGLIESRRIRKGGKIKKTKGQTNDPLGIR